MPIIDNGNNSAGKANVNSNFELATHLETDAGNKPEFISAVKTFAENDDGTYDSTVDLRSGEVDDDYRARIACDTVLDYDTLRTTIQNTKKTTFTFTTLAATLTASGLTTNSGSITTTNTGLTFGTHAMFSIHPTQTTVVEQTVTFTAQPTTNTIVDFGLFQRGASTAFAPLDGVYFRLTSAGLSGVTNSNGTETLVTFTLSDNVTPWAYVDNTNYKFLIQTSNIKTSFWVCINDGAMNKLGEILTPTGLSMPFLSQSLPWSIRHAIVGGASGDSTFRAIFGDYIVGTRGALYADSLGAVNSRVLGSYQTLTGSTPNQLVAGTVTSGTLAKPTAAIPANTSLVANLPNSLAGRIYEQLASGLVANVDGIFVSFTVPAGSSTVQGKRLKVSGITLSGMVSTVVVGGPAYTEWYIAFGHTADSLATTESASMASATTKAPVRVLLPTLTTNMAVTQAAGTLLVQPSYSIIFQNPIYVNPGERIALVGNKTITGAITSGVLSYTYQFDYTWE